MLEVEVPSSFLELRLTWLLDPAALPGTRGVELRQHLPLLIQLLLETDVAGEDYRTVVARLDDELVSYAAYIARYSGFLHVGSHPWFLSLQLCAEPERAADLAAWADRLAHFCDFPEEKVRTTIRRVLTDLAENMRDGGTVLAQVLPAAVFGPLSPQVLLGALAQRKFLERCCEDIAGTCATLRELRDAITAPTTACGAVVSGSDAERRRSVIEPLQRLWRGRHAATRPALLPKASWGAGAEPAKEPLLPLKHFVVGTAGEDTASVHLRCTLPPPYLSLDAGKKWALTLACEALSMMGGELEMAVRGKGLAYGVQVGFSPYDNAVTLDLMECTNVKKAVEGALTVLRNAVDGDALGQFQLENARGSIVFQLKGKRAAPSPSSTPPSAPPSAARIPQRRNRSGSSGWAR